MVLYGRNSESPVPVLAAATPGDCFFMAIEAARIALKYRTPVYLLSDAYLANGAEPWRIPDVDTLPDISTEFATTPPDEGAVPAVRARSGDARAAVGDSGHAGARAPDRRAREGRLDRQRLLRPRQPRPDGAPPRAEGRRDRLRHPRARGRRPGRGERCSCSAGAARTARSRPASAACARRAATSPRRTCATSTRSRATPARCCARYDRVLVPEMNLGQLAKLIRADFLVDAVVVQPRPRDPVPLVGDRRGDRGAPVNRHEICTARVTPFGAPRRYRRPQGGG